MKHGCSGAAQLRQVAESPLTSASRKQQFPVLLLSPSPSMIFHKTSPVQVIHMLAWNTAVLADWPGQMFSQWGDNQGREFQKPSVEIQEDEVAPTTLN